MPPDAPCISAENFIKANEITELIITGMMTHMCVDSTTRAAKDLGFECIFSRQLEALAKKDDILIRMIKKNYKYTEVGYDMYERTDGKSTAFRLKNTKSVFLAILNLAWENYFNSSLKRKH